MQMVTEPLYGLKVEKLYRRIVGHLRKDFAMEKFRIFSLEAGSRKAIGNMDRKYHHPDAMKVFWTNKIQ